MVAWQLLPALARWRGDRFCTRLSCGTGERPCHCCAGRGSLERLSERPGAELGTAARTLLLSSPLHWSGIRLLSELGLCPSSFFTRVFRCNLILPVGSPSTAQVVD